MVVKPWLAALLGGFVGSGLIVGVLAYRKHRALLARGAAMRAALEADADAATLYLVSKGAGIEPELRAIAAQAAERAGTYHLAIHYGITDELGAQIARAAGRLGSS